MTVIRIYPIGLVPTTLAASLETRPPGLFSSFQLLFTCATEVDVPAIKSVILYSFLKFQIGAYWTLSENKNSAAALPLF